jgi:hypothetical protein
MTRITGTSFLALNQPLTYKTREPNGLKKVTTAVSQKAGLAFLPRRKLSLLLLGWAIALPDLCERGPLVHGNVVGLVALDFVLRIILAGVARISLVF